MARLSVIAPFYNVQGYLDQCLRSIASQTFDDLEVVLVDDGSQDHSLDVAEEYAERDPRFRVVRQENQGLGPARNTGVRHASGDLITFVDTDDLLVRHAYELLVGSLDETGSDLAGGDARRFTSSWVRDSYTHRLPFEETVKATHVTRTRSLVHDRMIWNKVYRRDFWDRHALEFPAMLYEDYPVTLPAHVLAGAVDVLSQPVYFWREREGGEPSITQARKSVPNLRDRVRSAEMVLDFVSDHEPSLAPDVEAHLLHIDVDAVVGALHAAPDAERPEILALAQRLVGRIRGQVRADSRPVERLQAELVERGDLDRTLALLDHRDASGSSAPVVRTSRLRHRYAYDLPFRGDATAGLPADLYRAERPAVEMVGRVTDSAWKAGRLRMSGVAYLPGMTMGADSRMRVWLQASSGRTLPLEVERHDVALPGGPAQNAGFHVVVNPYLLGVKPAKGTWTLMAEVRTEGLTRSGPLKSSPATRAAWVRAEPLGGGWVAQPVSVRRNEVALQVRKLAVWVNRISALADAVEIEGQLRGPVEDDLELVLTSGFGATHVLAVDAFDREDGTSGFVASTSIEALDPAPGWPDPIEEGVQWTVRVRRRGKEAPLPVHHQVSPAVARSEHEQLHVGRNVRGNLALHLGPVTALVDTVRWSGGGGDLVVGGALARATASRVQVRLHCRVGPDLAADVVVDATTSGGLFAATIAVDDVLAATDDLLGRHHAADRPVTWQAALIEDGRPGRLQLPRPLLEQMPPLGERGAHDVTVVSERSSSFALHVSRGLREDAVVEVPALSAG